MKTTFIKLISSKLSAACGGSRISFRCSEITFESNNKNHCPPSAFWRNRCENGITQGLVYPEQYLAMADATLPILYIKTQRGQRLTLLEVGLAAKPSSDEIPPKEHTHRPAPAHTVMTLWDNRKLQPVSKGGLVTVHWLGHTISTP